MAKLTKGPLSMDDFPEILLADGFDKAFIGVGSRAGDDDIAVYDLEKCVTILVKSGMTYAESVEYIEYNVLGAYVGPRTPLFLDPMDIDDVRPPAE
jgi:hypothetical protein